LKEAKDFNTSRPFLQQDEKELMEIQKTITYDVRYLKIMNDWKENLKRKHKARARSLEILQNFVNLLSFIFY